MSTEPATPHAPHDHSGVPRRLTVADDPPTPPPATPADHDHDDPEQGPGPRLRDPARGRSRSVHEDADGMRLSLFGQDLLLSHKQGALEQVLRRLAAQVRLRRARGVSSPGSLAAVAGGAELPIDVTVSELRELLDHLEDLEVDDHLIEALGEQADVIAAGLARLVQAELDRRREVETVPTPEREVRGTWQGRDLVNVPPAEQASVEAAVRALVRRLGGARTRHEHRSQAGRVHVGSTLRHNLRYDAIPFEPVLRRRRDERPRLVVLCDVSLSTRNLARFWLQIVYGMQRLFARVRTFVFVADLAEATETFASRPFEAAVGSVLAGDLVDPDVNSDFGAAVGRFVDDHLDAVSRRTTVVVLGDGRNNGKPANEQALEVLAQRAKRLIWLTPEPRWGWSLGSCDMPRYEPSCSRVEVVRTLDQLGAAAEHLLRDAQDAQNSLGPRARRSVD